MQNYIELKNKFEKNKNFENSEAMSKYMRNKFIFYGIKSPQRKEIYKNDLKIEKSIGKIDWDLLNQSFDDLHREFQYFVIDYLKIMKDFLIADDLVCIKKYIKNKQWQDTIDGMYEVIGHMAIKDKNISDLMLVWSRDEDFWIRRIAINHQLGRKDKTNTDLLEEIILNNFNSQEFFINKAIGWSLREFSKTNPDWVRNFLKRHKQDMNKLSIREASKYI